MAVRIGVIGAGLMGADHARIVARELPGAELRIVCDADEARARKVAEELGADDVSADAAAVIARADVDALIVASPDPTHAPLARACIAAGKPVLLEKPLSQDTEECLGVIGAEIAAGRRHVQIGFMRRHDRACAELRAACLEGTIGRVLMMHNFHRNVETPAAGFTGAMAITNSAPHEFDIARHVLGCEYAALTAFQPRRSDMRVAPVFLVLETTDGRLVNVEINNNAAYGYDVRAELVGERGAMATTPLTYTRLERDRASATAHEGDWRRRYHDAYRAQNRDFLRFVETGRFSPVAADSWDGYAAAATAEAGVRALATGRKVTVEMEDRPEFYNRCKEAAE